MCTYHTGWHVYGHQTTREEGVVYFEDEVLPLREFGLLRGPGPQTTVLRDADGRGKRHRKRCRRKRGTRAGVNVRLKANDRLLEMHMSSSSVTSQPSIRGPPQPLMSIPFTSVSTDRGGDESKSLKRKALSPPAHDHFPLKRGAPSSSQAHSSCHSPETNKTSYPQLSQTKKIPHLQEKEGPPSNRNVESQEESPHSAARTVKEDRLDAAVEQSEATKMKDDAEQSPEMRRAFAIANKALEIEKLYRQDCETFGMVVKMLAAKEPSMEKQLLTSLKKNLTEIKERCLDDLRNFISEVNIVLKSD